VTSELYGSGPLQVYAHSHFYFVWGTYINIYFEVC